MTLPTPPALILASASPRRRELLAAWGYAFQAVDPAVDEASFEAKASSPTRLVELLAEAKAQAVRKQVRAGVILAADTVVAVEDKVYGKPADRAQAANTLRALSGKAHAVLTGICVMEAKSGKARAAHAVSHLKMKRLSESEIRDYVATGEPIGKAGAYAIQETGDRWVTLQEGSRTNVIGLPEELVRPMLAEAGVVPA